MIDAIASRAMGVQPQASAQPVPPPAAAPAAPPPAAAAPAKETAQGQAATQGAPKTEDDRMSADAILYEVEFGEGDKRKLTPQQIKSTFERYSALNYKNAQYKPITDLVDQIMNENPGATPAQVRAQIEAVMRANASNPQMGQQKPGTAGMPEPKGGQTNEDIDAAMKAWEEENAASLPPGYRDFMKGTKDQGELIKGMQAQMTQMARMLQVVLGQSQGVAMAAKEGMNQGQNMQVNAVRRTIATNIDRVQQALQLPDEAAQDFMTFAAERGFTMEDFVDPQLTMKVMSDFKNTKDSPEMERMRAIAARRQAYTGSLGPAPSGGAVPEPQGGTTFDKFASNILAQKGIG
jgi:hypothetical protein